MSKSRKAETENTFSDSKLILLASFVADNLSKNKRISFTSNEMQFFKELGSLRDPQQIVDLLAHNAQHFDALGRFLTGAEIVKLFTGIELVKSSFPQFFTYYNSKSEGLKTSEGKMMLLKEMLENTISQDVETLSKELKEMIIQKEEKKKTSPPKKYTKVSIPMSGIPSDLKSKGKLTTELFLDFWKLVADVADKKLTKPTKEQNELLGKFFANNDQFKMLMKDATIGYPLGEFFILNIIKDLNISYIEENYKLIEVQTVNGKTSANKKKLNASLDEIALEYGKMVQKRYKEAFVKFLYRLLRASLYKEGKKTSEKDIYLVMGHILRLTTKWLAGKTSYTDKKSSSIYNLQLIINSMIDRVMNSKDQNAINKLMNYINVGGKSKGVKEIYDAIRNGFYTVDGTLNGQKLKTSKTEGTRIDLLFKNVKDLIIEYGMSNPEEKYQTKIMSEAATFGGKRSPKRKGESIIEMYTGRPKIDEKFRFGKVADLFMTEEQIFQTSQGKAVYDASRPSGRGSVLYGKVKSQLIDYARADLQSYIDILCEGYVKDLTEDDKEDLAVYLTGYLSMETNASISEICKRAKYWAAVLPLLEQAGDLKPPLNKILLNPSLVRDLSEMDLGTLIGAIDNAYEMLADTVQDVIRIIEDLQSNPEKFYKKTASPFVPLTRKQIELKKIKEEKVKPNKSPAKKPLREPIQFSLGEIEPTVQKQTVTQPSQITRRSGPRVGRVEEIKIEKTPTGRVERVEVKEKSPEQKFSLGTSPKNVTVTRSPSNSVRVNRSSPVKTPKQEEFILEDEPPM